MQSENFPTAPKRHWSQVVDDMAELLAGLLSDSFDVVAVHFCFTNKSEPRYLLATNTGTYITISMQVDKTPPVQIEGKGSKSKDVEFDEFGIVTHSNPIAMTRQGAANQSLLRLYQALNKTGPDYGTDWPVVKDLLNVLLASKDDSSIVEFVEQPMVPSHGNSYPLHAEMCVLNHVYLNGYHQVTIAQKPVPRYLGVSKACCGFCWLFIMALNQFAGKELVSVRGFHGELYKWWNIPPFVYEDKYSGVLTNFKNLVDLFVGEVDYQQRKGYPGEVICNKNHKILRDPEPNRALNEPRSPQRDQNLGFGFKFK